MKIPKKISILGTEYKVILEDVVEDGYAGLCDPCNKTIHLKKELLKKDYKNEYNLDLIFKHEVFHAFLDEAGYHSLSENEDFVNLLAIQFKNLTKIFGYERV